jgi:hypothetical protein
MKALLIVLLIALPVAAGTPPNALTFDANADGRLDEEEVMDYVLAYGTPTRALEDQMADLLKGASSVAVETRSRAIIAYDGDHFALTVPCFASRPGAASRKRYPSATGVRPRLVVHMECGGKASAF